MLYFWETEVIYVNLCFKKFSTKWAKFWKQETETTYWDPANILIQKNRTSQIIIDDICFTVLLVNYFMQRNTQL